ncbi:MAG: InlB B-repeat-containing protein [Eggerthellaceae bacterium]|nr:InlB B-repeat-containing protein [Eggerthellaceae bacterium]
MPFTVALVLLLVFTLVPFFALTPPFAHAASDATIDLTDNNNGASYPNWSCSGNTYTITGDVTITGDTSGPPLVFAFDSPSGSTATATWDANYTKSNTVNQPLVAITGNGTFVIADTGSVVNNNNNNAITWQAGTNGQGLGQFAELIVYGEVRASAGNAVNMVGADASLTVEENAKVTTTSGGAINLSGTNASVTIKGEVEAAGSGTGITMSGANASVTVSGQVGAHTGSAISMSGNDASLTIEGDAWVYSSNNFAAVGTITMSGVDSELLITDNAVVDAFGSTTSYAIATNGKVSVSGGTVSTSGTQGRAIQLAGTPGGKAYITGGLVQATAPGGTAISTATSNALNAEIVVSGGVVRATTGNAIRAVASTASVTVTGGFVFSYGTNLVGSQTDNPSNSTIWQQRGASPSITGDGIVVAWDPIGTLPTPETDQYLEGTDDHLAYMPSSGATVQWDTEGLNSGIYYENGNTSGFFDMHEEVFVASCKIEATPSPIDFGELSYPYVQPAAQTITVTNIGTDSVLLAEPVAPSGYTIVVSPLWETLLAPGESATFTIQPDADLIPSDYSATLTVNASNPDAPSLTASADVEIAFVVYSDDNYITEFTLDGQIGDTVITNEDDPDMVGTITIIMPSDTDLAALRLSSLVWSDFATIDPEHEVDELYDLSALGPYTVTSESGKSREYTVRVLLQYTVTYEIENGTFGGTVTSTSEEVIWGANPVHVPTDMQPNPGFDQKPGSWVEVDFPDGPILEKTTFTYRYEPNDSYTVTYEIENGTFGGTVTTTSEQVIWGANPVHVPTDMQPNPGFDQKPGSWVGVDFPDGPILENTTFTYRYEPNDSYTVTFLDWDASVIAAVQVPHGADATPPADPTRDGWVFDGWNGDYTNVTEDRTIFATFVRELEPPKTAKYTVTYYGDRAIGSALATEVVLATEDFSGDIDSLATATIRSFTGYTHNAADTNNVLSAAIAEDGSLELKVYYTLNIYEVEFLDWDASAIDTVQVFHGADATPPADPTRDGWVFDGWNGDYTNVTEDRTIFATFVRELEPPKTAKYTVTYYGDRAIGGALATEIVLATEEFSGNVDSLVAAAIRSFTGYTHNAADTNNVLSAAIAKDGSLELKVYYTLNTYEVEFLDYDGTVLDTVQVFHGADATPPADPTRDGWIFANWNGDYANVTENRTVTASYIEEELISKIAKYTVTYYADRGIGGTLGPLAAGDIVLATDEFPGDVGSLVTAIIRSFTGYTHNAASPNNVLSGVIVEGDSLELEVYYTLNRYTVEFLDWDGTVIDTVQVFHGADATPPADPTRDGWVFDGWNGDYTNVTEKRTITATYVEEDPTEPDPGDGEDPTDPDPTEPDPGDGEEPGDGDKKPGDTATDPEDKKPATDKATDKTPDTSDSGGLFFLTAILTGLIGIVFMALSVLQRRALPAYPRGRHAR